MEERQESVERRDMTWWLVLGMFLGAIVAFWLVQKDEERRRRILEQTQRLRKQAVNLSSVTRSRAQQLQEQALTLQAEVSVEVERRLREGKETLDDMLTRVRKEVQDLQRRAQRWADDAQLQAQLARKKAELRALEARKRLRNLRP